MEPDPRLVELARRSARVFSLLAVAIGAVAMTGWVLDVDVLKSVVPGLVTMKANTAFCLIVTGGALCAMASRRPQPAANRLAALGAAAAGLLALIVFSQYVAGRDFGVDLLLFDEPAGQVGTVHPGRMAINTSIAFVLVSISLLLLTTGRGLRAVPVLALAVSAMSFVALAGYLSGVNTLYAIAKQTQMAVPTATGFMLLGTGLLLVRPSTGPMRLLVASGLGSVLARRVLPVMVLVPVGLSLLRLKAQEEGLVDTATGAWLLVTSIICLTLPLIWGAAASLSRAEAAREHVEHITRGRHQVSRALGAATSVPDALPRLLEAVCDSPQWVLGTVWLCEKPGDDALQLAATWTEDPHLERELRTLHHVTRLEPGLGMPGRVAITREPLWASNAADEHQWLTPPLAGRVGVGGVLGVPVMVRGCLYGVIELFPRSGNPIEPELHDAVVSMAGELGYVIERHHSEAARREAEERFRLSFEQAAIGMAVSSLDGRWLDVNPALCRLAGRTPEQLTQLTWQDITHPDDVAKADRIVDGAVSSFETETRYLPLGGGHVWAHVSGALIRDGAGRPLHWVLQVADVTARRRAEEEAAAARDAALEASRLKSEFVANMSHEIRTPMNGVIGLTELLLETSLDDEQHEYARLLRTSGETLMRIVNEILDVSKIEAGKMEIDRVDFALADAIEDVGELMAESAHDKGLELSVLVEAGVPARAHGDEIRLRQILSNLISNAVKFTDAGEVRVRASLTESAGDLQMVAVEVADTGIGIDPNRVDRLFESFTQADSSTTRLYGGTGLGLTIVRQLTEMMDGEVAVQSRPGHGSRFTFTLPFGVAEAQQAPRQGSGGTLAGQRLLVVDDNATNRKILEHHATAWGMRSDCAADAEEALQLMRAAAAEADPYAFAALDMHMPGMNGLELAKLMKADPALRACHLMLLTSSFNGRRAAREAGVSYVLRKPIRRARLLDALLHRDPVAVAAKEPLAGPAPPRGMTVLVAEDNEINRVLAVRLLERRGINADVAPNGREAVAMAGRKRYDAVLMDCHMPIMDGYEAARSIRRAEPDTEHMPVIAVSASSLPDDRRRCFAAGMDDFLAKPLEQAAFDTMLCRWLDRGDPPPEEAPANIADWATQASTEPLDRAAIERLRSDLRDDAMVLKLLELFRVQTAERLNSVDRAIAAGDMEALCVAAHTIKGGAASVGAPGVRDAAQALERAAQEDRAPHVRELADELREQFERSERALAQQEVLT